MSLPASPQAPVSLSGSEPQGPAEASPPVFPRNPVTSLIRKNSGFPRKLGAEGLRFGQNGAKRAVPGAAESAAFTGKTRFRGRWRAFFAAFRIRSGDARTPGHAPRLLRLSIARLKCGLKAPCPFRARPSLPQLSLSRTGRRAQRPGEGVFRRFPGPWRRKRLLSLITFKAEAARKRKPPGRAWGLHGAGGGCAENDRFLQEPDRSQGSFAGLANPRFPRGKSGAVQASLPADRRPAASPS